MDISSDLGITTLSLPLVAPPLAPSLTPSLFLFFALGLGDVAPSSTGAVSAALARLPRAADGGSPSPADAFAAFFFGIGIRVVRARSGSAAHVNPPPIAVKPARSTRDGADTKAAAIDVFALIPILLPLEIFPLFLFVRSSLVLDLGS